MPFATHASRRETKCKGEQRHVEAANDFLSSLDSELVLQNALMADAAWEALALTRFMDTDDMPIEELSYEVGAFCHKIKVLFFEGKIFEVDGFTKYTVECLQAVRMLRLRNGERRAFGGPHEPSVTIRQRCLSRMCAWAKLALEVASTEFPCWEVFQAFSVFNLSEKRKVVANKPDTYATHLEPLRTRATLSAPQYLPGSRSHTPKLD